MCKQGREAVVCPVKHFSQRLGAPGSAPSQFQLEPVCRGNQRQPGDPFCSLWIVLPSSLYNVTPLFLKCVSDTDEAGVMEVGQAKMRGGGEVCNSNLTLMICVQFKVRE